MSYFIFKLSFKKKEEVDNLVINLSAFTLNSLAEKRVFKNGLNLRALMAGSFYYFFWPGKKY
jgi:hypothetical protein